MQQTLMLLQLAMGKHSAMSTSSSARVECELLVGAVSSSQNRCHIFFLTGDDAIQNKYFEGY